MLVRDDETYERSQKPELSGWWNAIKLIQKVNYKNTERQRE